MSNSSVKYHPFTQTSEGAVAEDRSDHKRTWQNRSWVIAATIVLSALIAFVALAAIGIGLGTSLSVQQQQQDPGLQAVKVTQDMLEGEYYTAERGIRFRVLLTSTFVNFSVHSASGESVVFILHPVNSSMSIMGVQDTNFLFMENQTGRYDEYVIPKNMTERVKSMMEHQQNMTSDVMKQMNNKDVNKTRTNSFKHFTMSEDAMLIIDAAIALGESGIRGTEYQSAMKFYLIALRLLKGRSSENLGDNDHTSTDQSSVQRKSNQCPQSQGGGRNCQECPYNKYGNNCFGMCGKDCFCWSFVCGDCCLHEYCRSHDECCAIEGFFTFNCFAVVIRRPFESCEDTYMC